MIALLSSETFGEPRPAHERSPRRRLVERRRRGGRGPQRLVRAAASSRYRDLGGRLTRAIRGRCLADSKQSTVPAMATLSDSAGPAIGMRT